MARQDPSGDAIDGRVELSPALEYMLRCGLNDSGNSRRFTYRQRGKLVYATGSGYHRWTGQLWQAVDDEELRQEAKFVAKKIWDEVGAIEDEETRKRWARWALRSGNKTQLDAMIKLAAAGEFAPVDQPDLKLNGARPFDRNRDILNTPTGVIDLRTGNLLDHEACKDEYCTRMTRVPYDPEASMTGWIKWLQLFWPDIEDRRMLQRLAGGSITGYPLKLIVVLYGEKGDNGKTTLIETIKSTMGTYGAAAHESTFVNASSNEASYNLADLVGVRFASFVETREHHGLANERIKRVTGGDTITARAPYKRGFSYKPQFTLWVGTNYKPRIPAGDSAMWGRLRPMACNQVITPGKQIQDYAELLIDRFGPGILRWAVEGAREFYEVEKRAPSPTPRMREVLDEWKQEFDVVERWLTECTVLNPAAKAGFPQLWSSFSLWCESNGEERALKDYTSQKFHRELDRKGFDRSEKRSMGNYKRYGIELSSPSVSGI